MEPSPSGAEPVAHALVKAARPFVFPCHPVVSRFAGFLAHPLLARSSRLIRRQPSHGAASIDG